MKQPLRDIELIVDNADSAELIGAKLSEVLKLREDRSQKFISKRYKTTAVNKTNVGIARLAVALILDTITEKNL